MRDDGYVRNTYVLVLRLINGTLDAQVVARTLHESDFGGASVTIPLKLDVIPLMDALSPAALAIGAVNTIVSKSKAAADQKLLLIGDNTDWLGILRPIQRRLERAAPRTQHPVVALVIGAGGTAMAASYAMQQLGATLFVYNRTFSKAEAVARRFNGTALRELKNLDGIDDLDIVIGTIPAAAQTDLPASLFKTQPIVLDAAYKPAMTPLLRAAKASGCPCIQGAEMLYEQALEQFNSLSYDSVGHHVDSCLEFNPDRLPIC